MVTLVVCRVFLFLCFNLTTECPYFHLAPSVTEWPCQMSVLYKIVYTQHHSLLVRSASSFQLSGVNFPFSLQTELSCNYSVEYIEVIRDARDNFWLCRPILCFISTWHPKAPPRYHPLKRPVIVVNHPFLPQITKTLPWDWHHLHENHCSAHAKSNPGITLKSV